MCSRMSLFVNRATILCSPMRHLFRIESLGEFIVTGTFPKVAFGIMHDGILAFCYASSWYRVIRAEAKSSRDCTMVSGDTFVLGAVDTRCNGTQFGVCSKPPNREPPGRF